VAELEKAAQVRGRATDDDAESRFRRLLDSLGLIGVYGYDRWGIARYWNRACEKLYGYSADEAIGERLIDLIVPPELRTTMITAIERGARTGRLEVPPQMTLLHRDGSPVRVHANHVVIDPGTEVVRFYCFDLDLRPIDALHRQLEQRTRELQAERDRARLYLEVAATMILALDAQGKIIVANREAARVLEVPADELAGRDWFDEFLPEDVRDEVRARFLEVIEGRRLPSESYENRVRSASGELRLVHWRNAPITGSDGRIVGTVSSGEDVTEARRLEREHARWQERSQHAQKLESLGLLAGGIAHDFNNMLAAILGNAELALLDLPPSSSAQASIEEVRSAAHNSRDLCRQLLVYAGRAAMRRAPVDLRELALGMKRLLEATAGDAARLRLDIPGGLPSVEGDEGQLRQVILNLVVNAAEALGPSGGSILVTAGRTCAEDEVPASFLSGDPPAGPALFLSVSDDGPGIDPAALERIFEPFFSSRSKGRGLGLSIVHGVVRRHGGAITVDTAPGRGTTFRIVLPAMRDADAPSPEVSPAADAAPALRGRVLVVDDETSVRDVVERMLQRLGFTTVTAPDGAEGLRLFREQDEPLDLVVADMAMPRMSGDDLAREIARLAPEVPVLLMSGYSDKDAPAGMDRLTVLEKPFQLKDLRQRLERLLG
jgi:PAS domain S-box-containing protein